MAGTDDRRVRCWGPVPPRGGNGREARADCAGCLLGRKCLHPLPSCMTSCKVTCEDVGVAATNTTSAFSFERLTGIRPPVLFAQAWFTNATPLLQFLRELPWKNKQPTYLCTWAETRETMEQFHNRRHLYHVVKYPWPAFFFASIWYHEQSVLNP